MDTLDFAEDDNVDNEMDLTNRVGAWLTADGCFFRVWAPNAIGVTVLLQDGPTWNDAAAFARHALTNANGYWSATVPGVKAGRLYRFEIKQPDGGLLQRLDAAGRGVISSDLTRDDPSSHNASIVLGADPYPWYALRDAAVRGLHRLPVPHRHICRI